ncbi:type II/III secretion system protein [Legionella jordanis]|uniref:Type II/III secretion system protein n=1 Tax=Legionella jordanis TaxID=456 RepID=A0A0W0VBM9_9GAMM|nr:type II/III secretion system protein [Legionella jordanis]KTD17496.1 type II/III secretion system protein [Legionella jordanis]RMX05165.1 type II/III secretion system protein [Legionella jordanis]RMX17421.1 type II/III secretion system protein [Legionella jordanis]VEH13465.1 type II/III secretion system protein [Legionella jordanis]
MVVRWIFIILLFSNAAWADELITKVIDLHYQNADAVIKLLQPLLQTNEQITGSGQTLIVKVQPNTLTQIRDILHKIDQPPVTFQITVYQGDPDWLSTANSDSIVISTSSASQQKRRQSIEVMNGESAFVSTGEDQPVISSVGVGWLSTGVSYNRRLVQNGLLVEPQLQGQKVKLTVRRIREQDSNASNQQFDQQQVVTTVLIPLNEWVSLGSAEGDAPADADTTVYRAGNQYTQNSTLYIKVNIVQKSSSGIQK